MTEAVVYTRVSSAEQLREGFSIAAQEIALREYAARNGIRIVAEFSDDETAKTIGRPAFGRMLQYLRDHPGTEILVEKVDRLYRNFKDYIVLDDLGVDIHFVKEGGRNRRDADARFMDVIRVGIARKYVENLSEEVKKGMRQKAAQGAYPSWAPVGYLNATDSQQRKAVGLVRDPVKAPLVLQLFEEAASGRHSLGALVRWADQAGLRGRKGRPISKSAMVKLLRNLAYTGMFLWAGKEYRGVYEPLISPELWDRVQAVLDGKNRPKVATHTFTFTGILRCGDCGGLLSGDRKKGRYVYYSCRCSRAARRYYAERELDAEVSRQLSRLVIPSDIRERVFGEIDRWYQDAARKEQTKIARLRTRLAEIEAASLSAYEEKLLNRIPESMWRDLSEKWRAEAQRLRETIATLEPRISRDELLRATRAPFELAERAAAQYLLEDAPMKGAILRTCVSNCLITHGSISIHLRSPLDVIAPQRHRRNLCAPLL